MPEIASSYIDMDVSNKKECTDEQNYSDVESQLLQMNKTVSNIQQRLEEEQSLLQSSRLGIGIIIMMLIIILGLTILYYSSLLNTLTSTLIHGACLAGIGIVIALLCTILPKNKKNH